MRYVASYVSKRYAYILGGKGRVVIVQRVEYCHCIIDK